jgi:lysine 2,3-aminomutase
MGNQPVLSKGINDDAENFKKLQQKFLVVWICPFYVFYCEPSPGINYYSVSAEKKSSIFATFLAVTLLS